MAVVSVHIGQAGVQLGDMCWSQYTMEHGLSETGYWDPPNRDMLPLSNSCNKEDDSKGKLEVASNLSLKSSLSLKSTNNACALGDAGSVSAGLDRPSEGIAAFYQEVSTGCYCPRAIYVDLESTVIDEIRHGRLKGLYSPELLVSGKEDAANNYARGYYTVGKAIHGSVMDKTRKLVEGCDRLQGFMMFHSTGGGTGSGFHALHTQALDEEYCKATTLGVSVFPSPRLATAVVEPYNAVLNTHNTLEHSECVFIADNEAMYNICQKRLGIDSPDYNNLNRLLATTVSSLTASLRFNGSLNADFADFQTNLVPYPRIHFPVMSYAPIAGKMKASHESLSAVDLTLQVFDTDHRLATCDTESGRYMACCLLYRGDVTPKEVNAAISHIKGKKSVRFVTWSPTAFKVGINHRAAVGLDEGSMMATRKTVCMVSNTTGMQKSWEALNTKFDVMLRKRAFLHWYKGEGMEDEDFVEAQANVTTLEQDYSKLG